MPSLRFRAPAPAPALAPVHRALHVLRSVVAVLGGGLLLAAAPAGTGTRTIGAWTLAPSKDGSGCFITRVYDRTGGTTLLLGLDTSGENHLSVLNANWSIRPKERLKLDFRLSSGSYAKHFAVGIAADGKQGFVTSFEGKFPTYFAQSERLAIARGAVPVERLPLDGSGAAVAALKRCVADLRRAPAAARAKGPASDIPRDPFAPAGGRRGN